MLEKVYAGIANQPGLSAVVYANGRPIEPDGRRPLRVMGWQPYDWGPSAVRAVSLAVELLFDATGSKRQAAIWADQFAAEVVSKLPSRFVLLKSEVVAWHSAVRPPQPCSEIAYAEKPQVGDGDGAAGL